MAFALSHDLRPQLVAIADLKPLGEATRRHSPHQVKKLRRGIREFGQVAPILLDEKNRVIDGMALVHAMKAEGFGEVQAVAITGLSEAKVRTLRLMLNRLGEDSRWDTAALRVEFAGILHLETTSKSKSPASKPRRSTPSLLMTGRAKRTSSNLPRTVGPL